MNITRTNHTPINKAPLKAQAPAQEQQQQNPEPPASSGVAGDIFAGAAVGAMATGIPAAAGALMSNLSGPAKAGVALAAPVVAAAGFGGYCGYKTYKSMKGHPVLTGMAAIGGAALAGFGTQIGIIPGLQYGFKGVIGGAAIGAAALGGLAAYASIQTSDF